MSQIIRTEKKLTSFQKLFVFFRPEGLLLSKDQTGKTVVEILVYKTIKCLNALNDFSFYFKTHKAGYGLFFKGLPTNDAQKWFENLITLVERDEETRTEIRELDLTQSMGVLILDSEITSFDFVFSKTIEKIKNHHKNSLEHSHVRRV